MTAVRTLTVSCPACGGDVEVRVVAAPRRLQVVGSDLVVDLVPEWDHTCQGPPGPGEEAGSG